MPRFAQPTAPAPAIWIVTLAAGLILWTGMVSPTQTARGAEYYVRPTGDDDNPGTAAEPFATVETGVYELSAGDTLYIGNGVYHEGEIYPDAIASPSNPITIRNIPGENPILDGDMTRWVFIELIQVDGYVIENLTCRNYYDIAISCVHTGYVTIRNCVCFGNGSAGVGLNYASYPNASYNAHITVEDCVCYNNGWGIGWASGIHLNNKGTGSNTSHIIRRNICYNNYDGSDNHTDGNGIMFDIGGGGYCLIENNLCFNNGGRGIISLDGRADIVNNTCFRNGWDADFDYQDPEIVIREREYPGSAIGTTVRNNIIWARPMRETDGTLYGGVFGYLDMTPAEFTFANNVLYADVPAEVTLEPWMVDCVKADPQFRATAMDNTLTTLYGATFLDMTYTDYDFTLHRASPAVDTGTSTGAPADDLIGTARPKGLAWDIGVYEFVPVTGDLDDDRDVDADDIALLIACSTGPAIPYDPANLPAGCTLAPDAEDIIPADHDRDGDVDQADFGAIQRCINSPGVTPGPPCLN